MRSLAVLLLLVGTAAADPKTAAALDSTKCHKVWVGKGLERHAVCQVTQDVVVKSGTPKPNVTYVTRDGKTVTGRPKTPDRLSGLSHTLH